MAGFLQLLETGINMIRTSPVVAEYAEPVAEAIITGSGKIVLPQGTISVKQSGGAAAKFTPGTALLALEKFLFTNELTFTVGTTVFDYAPHATAEPIPAASN